MKVSGVYIPGKLEECKGKGWGECLLHTLYIHIRFSRSPLRRLPSSPAGTGLTKT